VGKNHFEPSYLKIQRGDVVEWVVSDGNIEQNENSLYYFANRSHVVSFDNLNAESELLSSGSDSFKLKFLEKGVYTYRC
jgi:plastocyanin